MHPLFYVVTGVITGIIISCLYQTFRSKSKKESVIIDIQVNSKNAIKEISKLQDAIYILEQRIKKLQ